MASIKLILRTHQADQTGHSPLYIRIIKDRKTKFITAGVKLKENEWDEVKQKVKKNHPNSARMNAALSQKIADAEGQVADVGSKDVYFDDITVSVLKDYMAHMGNILKNGATTQRYSIMILAIMFKEAIKEDIIPEYMYPFNKLTLKKDTEKRVFLNKDQIEKLTNLELKEGKKADLWRDLFLFSIYAGGLRFSDVIELQYTNYNSEEQRIKKVIRKTGRLHQFKIGKVAIDILNKYIKEDAQPDDYIFPIITDKKSYNKSEEIRYFISQRENHSANFQLNRMGKMLKLPFPLSFHLSRHSFATNALNNGMRIEHVSKLMDHTDISTTQIYAKIISEELDKAVDNYIF